MSLPLPEPGPPLRYERLGRLRAAALVALAAALVAILSWSLYRREVAAIEEPFRERESRRVALQAHLLLSELRPAIDHVLLLADGDGLRAFLASGQPGDLERAIQRATFVSRHHRDYAQVRYLDESGREVLRVNGGGRVLPAPALQDKSDQPYFVRAAGLQAGQIHVSAFDLNIEAGRLEQPLVSTIRFATPVFDANGTRRGVYVIDYLGNALLGRLEQLVPAFAHRFRLLDARGHWLKARDPAQEWGFQIPERADFTLSRSDPALWAELTRAAEGQVSRAGGLFTWQRVALSDVGHDEPGVVVADDEFLILASEVGAPEFGALFASLRQTFLLLTTGLLALAASSVWFFDARRRARQAQQVSEARYRTLFDSIDEGFCIIEMIFDRGSKPVDYRFLEVNPSFERQTGLKDARGKTMRELAPQHEEHWFEIYGRIATSGEALRFQNRAEQLHRSYDVYAFRFGVPEDRQVAILFNDISEHQRVQEELDRFFSLSLDCLCIASGDGFFKRVSPAITDILGWTPEEFLATPYLELVHPEDRAATEREVERQVKAGQKVLHFENRYRHKDGSWRVLSWRSVPHDGLMYGTARDVTEVKAIEQVLREANEQLERRVQARTAELQQTNESLRLSERRFRALIEHGADGISVIDAANNILYLSPAVTAVEGYTAEELAGRNGLENTHPDDLPLVQAVVQKLVAHPGQPIPVLWRRRHKDGRWLWLEGVATNLLDDPAVKGIVTNYRDVTEQKRAEEQVQALNVGLERRVIDRTNQLEAVNQELEAFSYSVSHDLRAPLRHILGFAEMLTRELEGQLSEKARRYLKTISDAGGDMGELIDDLLAFSKMGRVEMHEQRVDPDALVQKARQDLELAVRGRNIVWKVASLPAVHGDPAMLQQVFANLLGNAVKYTRPRNPAEIEIRCSGREGDRVVLCVRDNGAGFDMKYADKLFGVFQRLHRADEFEGTGIGLANVRRIVTRHGGRTWAEGAVGQGASFYFTLRAAAATQAPPTKEAP